MARWLLLQERAEMLRRQSARAVRGMRVCHLCSARQLLLLSTGAADASVSVREASSAMLLQGKVSCFDNLKAA
jgi:hypothetical protein